MDMAARTRGEYWAQQSVALLKRIVFRIGIVVALIAFEFLVIGGVALLAFIIEKVPARIQEFASIALLLIYIAAHLLFWILVVYPPSNLRNRWLKKDAERWLEERNATGYRPNLFLRKLLRQTIWIPSVLALGILLFYPELWGLWSERHLSRPVTVAGHTINVPRTWILFRHGQYVDWIILRGAGKGRLRNWWDLNPPAANVVLESNNKKFYANPEQGRLVRTIRNGNLELLCWQRPLEYQAVLINCTSSNGEFSAEFYGDGIFLEDFYAAIEK